MDRYSEVSRMLGEFLNAVSAVVVLLMLMAVGYFMGTKGWMKAEE